MLQGIGIDLTEIERVKKVVANQPQFITKVLTSNERQQMTQLQGQRQWEYLSGRWSLKESFAKAYGTGIGQQVGFQDIEILDNGQGKPVITKSPFPGQSLASVSHTGKLVVTQVVLEKETTNHE
ncbi:holo-ACP synthase [uncultured Limosilactobacillus sp.]|uniref:holo-ACP synthase n=1 Tax=uncultured Limosilactobacillus sp. TaxID=2837629 RepID=UPI0025D6CB26|nr:holo-ACP synthase [uncultured Limosilactobacillus sp.]